jgi:predicted nucleic acid-binding protein
MKVLFDTSVLVPGLIRFSLINESAIAISKL